MKLKEFKTAPDLCKINVLSYNIAKKYDKEIVEPYKKTILKKKSSKNKEGLIIVRNKDMLHSLITDNTPLGLLDVSLISDFSNLFFCKQRKDYSGIENWDVSNATNMRGMFDCSNFNGDIGKWDVSNVKNMSFMFANTDYFNNDISKWNVSNVTNMEQMFRNSVFNQNICNWNVCNCLNMNAMFYGSKFNQNLSKWTINDECFIDQMFDISPMEEKNLPECIQIVLSTWKDNADKLIKQNKKLKTDKKSNFDTSLIKDHISEGRHDLLNYINLLKDYKIVHKKDLDQLSQKVKFYFDLIEQRLNEDR